MFYLPYYLLHSSHNAAIRLINTQRRYCSLGTENKVTGHPVCSLTSESNPCVSQKTTNNCEASASREYRIGGKNNACLTPIPRQQKQSGRKRSSIKLTQIRIVPSSEPVIHLFSTAFQRTLKKSSQQTRDFSSVQHFNHLPRV